MNWEAIGASVVAFLIGSGYVITWWKKWREKQPWDETTERRQENRLEQRRAEDRSDVRDAIRDAAHEIRAVQKDAERLAIELSKVREEFDDIPSLRDRVKRLESDWRQDHKRLGIAEDRLHYLFARLNFLHNEEKGKSKE